MSKESQEIKEMMLSLWIVFLLLLLLILYSSCSASYHLQKAKQKQPAWFSDTLTTSDTVYIPTEKIVAQTVFKTDTITLTKFDTITNTETLIRLVRTDPDCDSVRVEVDCPDVKVVTDTVKLPPIVLEPTWWDTFKTYGWVLLLALGAGFLLAIKIR